jgi:DNA-binding NarL/FixJ family response regulator
MVMEKTIRSVLIVGSEPGLSARLEPLLKRSHLDVDRVSESAAARSLVEAVAIDILVLSASMTNPSLDELLAVIRASESPCRRSAVLVLGVEPADASPAGVEAPTRFLAPQATDAELNEAIASLFRESPRLTVRIAIRIETQLGSGSTMVLTQTENVSRGGMLVRMTRPQPVGASLRFELLLPAGFKTVTGIGEVVRHTQDVRGRVSGIGMRFAVFDGEGREVLADFLDRKVG